MLDAYPEMLVFYCKIKKLQLFREQAAYTVPVREDEWKTRTAQK